ncbi:hypothetical protein GGF50DRAFT_115180 [Schizophyllum commune]
MDSDMTSSSVSQSTGLKIRLPARKDWPSNQPRKIAGGSRVQRAMQARSQPSAEQARQEMPYHTSYAPPPPPVMSSTSSPTRLSFGFAPSPYTSSTEVGAPQTPPGHQQAFPSSLSTPPMAQWGAGLAAPTTCGSTTASPSVSSTSSTSSYGESGQDAGPYHHAPDDDDAMDVLCL